MKSPDINLSVRLTREQVEASFRPCPVCGEIERETTSGVYRIEHNYSQHGIAPPPRQRMETEELFGIPRTDWNEVIR